MTARTYALSPAAVLFHADCRDALRALPDNCIDSVVTDPPYALVSIVKRFGSPTAAPAHGNEAYMRASAGFMGKTWDTGETAMAASFWADVLRVLKPGGHVAAFGATRGYHRMACAIEDAGFEIRDSLAWIYGTGFPKSHDVSKGVDRALGGERELVAPRSAIGHQRNIGNTRPYMDDPNHMTVSDVPATAAAEWEGWGTALKPAFEPIVLARKPLSEGTVAANVLRWRTGALNIGGTRIEGSAPAERHAPKQIMRGGNFHAAAETEKEMSHYVPSAEGRWPANVVHDGSAEVLEAFPVTAPSKRNSKSAEAYVPNGKNDVYGEGMGGGYHPGFDDAGNGSAARFFYSAKASKADRNGSKHPTVKPIALMQWLARLITPPGGTVLDPFAGSGTTGAACALEGFNAVLCEREAEYVTDIRNRFDPNHHTPPRQPGRRIYGVFADEQSDRSD